MPKSKNTGPVSVNDTSCKPDMKHLNVIGFVKNTSNLESENKRNIKLKKAKDNIIDAGTDIEEALKLTIKQFKADSVDKIKETEHKIADFKKKTAGSNNEIIASYQHHIDQLESNKTSLMAALETFREDGESEWKMFKHQFGKDLKEFENEIGGFIKNFGNQ